MSRARFGTRATWNGTLESKEGKEGGHPPCAPPSAPFPPLKEGQEEEECAGRQSTFFLPCIPFCLFHQVRVSTRWFALPYHERDPSQMRRSSIRAPTPNHSFTCPRTLTGWCQPQHPSSLVAIRGDAVSKGWKGAQGWLASAVKGSGEWVDLARTHCVHPARSEKQSESVACMYAQPPSKPLLSRRQSLPRPPSGGAVLGNKLDPPFPSPLPHLISANEGRGFGFPLLSLFSHFRPEERGGWMVQDGFALFLGRRGSTLGTRAPPGGASRSHLPGLRRRKQVGILVGISFIRSFPFSEQEGRKAGSMMGTVHTINILW
ncbi:hypothetical protein IE53DRAFT_241257 [Violaceomyces palustris]|uniref:Uncharacterized protein n=1 Tax=Violaceomyces palustris TaxID=1673888 RepID=A0ACD0NP56_9BASI|nr:hypothetical protein IE53DRAFT_241257 [Violaceomyces palustris]